MNERRATLRGQWFGETLRKIRKERRVKLAEAAEFLNRDPSQVSRFENGLYPVPRQELPSLLDFYRVHDEQRRTLLLKFNDEAWRSDWWDGYSSEVEDALIDYVWLESRATAIRVFDVMSVHGLLQTPDYIRALLRAENPDVDDEQIERWTDLRLKRQTILQRETPPPLGLIVDEAALRRRVGGPRTQVVQLRELVTRASGPSIELRVLPFDVGAHASPDGSFNIFSLEEPYPDVVYVGSPGGGLYLEQPKVERFATMYDRLKMCAIAPDASIAYIESIAKDLEQA